MWITTLNGTEVGRHERVGQASGVAYGVMAGISLGMGWSTRVDQSPWKATRWDDVLAWTCGPHTVEVKEV